MRWEVVSVQGVVKAGVSDVLGIVGQRVDH